MKFKENWKIVLVISWLVFTLSLAAWWLVFGLQQNDQLQLLADASHSTKIIRQHSMLLWEGGILLVSLLGGGVSLFYFVLAEMRQNRRLKEFFATFSHEIKTSLTSLRLQAEALQEDLAEQPSSLLNRLVGDTVRLEIQLENSLFLANEEKRVLHIEKMSLAKIVRRISDFWAGVIVDVEKDAFILVDARAIESVLKNVFYNSVIHGEASAITISAEAVDAGVVKIRISDNGHGFSGNATALGKLFLRHNSRSGSGLGLYLVKKLSEEMNGEVVFSNTDQGFAVDLFLPGALT